jgi:Helix-turn-helix domain
MPSTEGLSQTQTTQPQLLTESQAAVWLCHGLSTIRRWRREGNGPPYIRIGHRIFYRPTELVEFVESHHSNRGGQ